MLFFLQSFALPWPRNGENTTHQNLDTSHNSFATIIVGNTKTSVNWGRDPPPPFIFSFCPITSWPFLLELLMLPERERESGVMGIRLCFFFSSSAVSSSCHRLHHRGEYVSSNCRWEEGGREESGNWELVQQFMEYASFYK